MPLPLWLLLLLPLWLLLLPICCAIVLSICTRRGHSTLYSICIFISLFLCTFFSLCVCMVLFVLPSALLICLEGERATHKLDLATLFFHNSIAYTSISESRYIYIFSCHSISLSRAVSRQFIYLSIPCNYHIRYALLFSWGFSFSFTKHTTT